MRAALGPGPAALCRRRRQARQPLVLLELRDGPRGGCARRLGPAGTDEDILSTYNDGGYEELAGTSQATPFVSGVAALLVAKGIRGQAAVQRILATARDLGSPGPDLEFGAGLVDASRAVAGLGTGSPAGGGAGGGAPTPNGSATTTTPPACA